jgi:hypothetical protein
VDSQKPRDQVSLGWGGEVVMAARDELGYTEKTNGLVLLLFALVAVVVGVGVFRPKAPSPFSHGSGYGAGHGSAALMFGANPRDGAGR